MDDAEELEPTSDPEGEEESEEELEEDYQELVYGIPVPEMTEGLQPIEVIVLIKGVNMEDGSPTMTTVVSPGMTTWEAAGLMVIALERVKTMAMMDLFETYEDEDDEDE